MLEQNDAFYSCHCPENSHWVEENMTCVENAVCNELEFYHWRTHECTLKTDCPHDHHFNYETYTCEYNFDCWDIHRPWFRSGYCIADCDTEEFQRDSDKMECLCLDNETMYWKNFYAELSGIPDYMSDPIGGECTAIPNCTAGTVWHSHEAKCDY
jgi:hypothetical protein